MDDKNPTSHEPEEAGPALDCSEGPSPKKSRRAVEKRVVSVPIGVGDWPRNKIGGETAPPTDSWAWRKYGQKPIKGSPYPRGYYRCSSWKGCPARKQVERSRVDPTTLVVTYSAEHNHPWPLPKNNHHHAAAAVVAPSEAASPESKAKPVARADPGPIQADPEETFADLIAGDVLGGGEFAWFSDMGSPSTSTSPTEGSDDTMLYGSIAGSSAAILCADGSEEKVGVEGRKKEEEEEDSLFAGLGELPEFSVVFRRGFQAAAMASTG